MNFLRRLFRKKQSGSSRAVLEQVVKDFPDAQVLTVEEYRRADAHNERGADYLDKDDFEAAIREFRQALGIMSSNSTYHMNLGNALISEGLARNDRSVVMEGISSLENSLRLDSDNQRAQQNLERIRAHLPNM